VSARIRGRTGGGSKGVAAIAALVLGLTSALAAHAADEPPISTAREAAVPTVTLKEALRKAESDPPSVLVAAASLERARATESAAEGAYLPSLTGQATGGINYDNRIYVPGLPRFESKALLAQGTVTLDWAALTAVRGANIDAAKASVKALTYGREAAKRQAMVAVAEMYIRAYAATDLVKDAELTLQRRTDQHTGILALTRTGLRQPVDAQRAEIEVVSARYLLEGRRDDEVAWWAALAVVLGRSPTSPLRPAESAGAVFDMALSPARARTLAVSNRPELEQSRSVLTQREAEESAAKGARLPTVGVLGSANASYTDTLSGLGVDGSQYGASALAYLRWSGLDPSVWYKGDIAEAATLEAKRQVDAASLAVAGEAVASVHAVIRSKTDRDRAVAVLGASQATREAQNGRYRAGLASLLELLDAENLEQDARRSRIEAERDYQIAQARLLASCGLLARVAR
jgi:outer membrane protein